MVEEFCFTLTTEFQSVCASTKAFTECTDEPSFRIKDNNRLAAHARLVDRMPDVDVPLLILAQPMRVAPHQSLRRNKPVMHALVRMYSGTDNWRSITRFVGGLKIEP